MAGYELATAYVNLVVETGAAGKQIGSVFKGAETVASNAGRGAGSTFAKAFSSQKPIDLKREADKAAAQVDVAAKKVQEARSKEEAAARKVAIEEAKLAEQRASGNTKTSTILQTEDRLARAKDAAALASQNVENALQQEANAKAKAISATDQLEASQRDATRSTNEAGQSYMTLRDRIKAALQGNFKGAFSKIPAEAEDAADKVEDKFEDTGAQSASRFGDAFKRVLGPVLAAISAGSVIKVGFEGAMELQASTKTLTGLYNSASDARDMVQLLKGVAKDSPLDLAGYSGAAETLAYAGVQGQRAADVLGNVGKAIVTAGGDTQNLDQAMNGLLKGVNNGGIAMMDSLGMISESGVPILSGLAEHFGTTTDQVKKMASSSQISVEDVLTVLEKGTGDTFQQMIDASGTASGSLQNQWAIAKDRIKVSLGEAFLPLMENLAPMIAPLTDKLIGGITGVIEVIKGAFDWFQKWEGVITPVASALAGIALVVGIYTGGLKAMAIATTIATAAQRLLNSAFLSSPLGWIALAIGALAGVLTWFFTKTETGAALWKKIWGGIKTAAGAVVDWFKSTALPVLQAVWDGIATGALWLWNNALKPAFEWVVSFWQGTLAPALMWLWNSIIKPVFGFIGTLISVWWNGIVKPIFNALVVVWQNVIAPALLWLWNSVIKPIFGFIGVLISVWWNNVVKPIFNALVAVWKNVVAPVLQWLWNSIIKPVFGFIGTLIKVWWNSVVKPVFNALVAVWKNVIAPVLNWLKGVFSAVFSLIGAVIKYWWNNTVKPQFAALVAVWKNVIAPALRWLWSNIFKPIFGFIGNFIKHWWLGVKVTFQALVGFVKNTLGPIFRWLRDNVVKPVFNGIKTAIKTVWENGIKPVFTALGNFIKDKVAPKFKGGVDAIGRAWNKVKEIAKKPVRFVVDTVINKGIVGSFNKIVDAFPGAKKMPELKLPKGFRTGGKVWGPGTETSDSIPARLSRNEHVWTAKEVRGAGGHSAVYAMRRAAANGKLARPGLSKDGVPAFKSGGTLSDAARWLQSKGARITEFKAWGQPVGRHAPNSYHYTGNAFDANYGPGGQNATEMAFFDRVLPQLHSLFPSLRTLWRVAGHYNHLHMDTAKGGSVGSGGPGEEGGGAGLLDMFTGPFKALKDKLNKQFKKFGRFGEIAKGMGKKAIDIPIEWIKENIANVGEVASEAWGNVKDTVSTRASKEAVRMVAHGYGWGSGNEWSSLVKLVQGESGWNINAANPSSSARGLFQKMTSLHGPVEKTAFGQAQWGLKYIKDSYGSPSRAYAKWLSRSPHWYAKGGAVAPTPARAQLFDGGGLLHKGVQLVEHKRRRPDRVLSEEQWDGIYAAATGAASGLTVQVTTPTVERDEIGDWTEAVKYTFAHLAKSDAFSGVNG